VVWEKAVPVARAAAVDTTVLALTEYQVKATRVVMELLIMAALVEVALVPLDLML
jgi:hypothetical protein